MEFKITIDPSLSDIVKVGYIQFDQIEVTKKNNALIQDMDELAAQLRIQYSTPHDALDRLNITRSFYRTIGLDPTKTRPSSEALLRRILKGNSIYQVNSVVDICNLCSLSFLLSIGLYDFQKIKGQVQLRLGAEGEGYPGIGKESINLSGRLSLVDDIGPFGNPSSDSARTKIIMETREVVFVVFAPATYPASNLETHLTFIEEKMKKYHACRSVTRGVL